MGVGQLLSMKLKNVHLPHPHPNGGLSDSFHGEGVGLALFLAATVVGRSEVTTAGSARDAEGGAHIHIHMYHMNKPYACVQVHFTCTNNHVIFIVCGCFICSLQRENLIT